MTQSLLGLQAALITLNGGIIALTDLDDGIKAVIVLASSLVLAFIGPFIPKVSLTMRRVLDLRRG